MKPIYGEDKGKGDNGIYLSNGTLLVLENQCPDRDKIWLDVRQNNSFFFLFLIQCFSILISLKVMHL